MSLKVGKCYYSYADNLVEIFNELILDDEEGHPIREYEGRVVKTIKGHDSLINKIQIFNAEGHWFNQDKQLLEKSIHNLKEEAPDGTK
jgi:hypothetical protein